MDYNKDYNDPFPDFFDGPDYGVNLDDVLNMTGLPSPKPPIFNHASDQLPNVLNSIKEPENCISNRSKLSSLDSIIEPFSSENCSNNNQPTQSTSPKNLKGSDSPVSNRLRASKATSVKSKSKKSSGDRPKKKSRYSLTQRLVHVHQDCFNHGNMAVVKKTSKRSKEHIFL